MIYIYIYIYNKKNAITILIYNNTYANTQIHIDIVIVI